MTQQIEQPEPEPHRAPTPITVSLDMAEFDAIGAHLKAAAKLLHDAVKRHTNELTGLALAAEASAQADLRAAERDAQQMLRYLGSVPFPTMGGAV